VVAHADPNQPTVHVVQPGETLSQIAVDAGTDADTLVRLNGLDDPNSISIGASLKLPGAVAPAAAPRDTYTVSDGDTLWAIAARFNTTADVLLQLNHLDDPNHLPLGAALTVPSARAHASPAPRPSSTQVVSYTVQPGDTLNQIARQFDVTASVIAQSNSLDDPNKVVVGMVLKLPAGATQVAAAVSQPPAQPPSTAAQTPTPSPKSTPTPTTTSTPTPTPAPRQSPAPANPPPASSATPGAANTDLAGAALKLLGAPYVWGGSSPSGFDCSGLVWYVARQQGKPISRDMAAQYDSGSHPGRDQLQPGDLVFFQDTWKPGLSHNGVYVGNGQFVNAADEATGVTLSSLNSAYWSAHWFGATRLP
jgi:cell wall-associated NlpC family hydrolase